MITINKQLFCVSLVWSMTCGGLWADVVIKDSFDGNGHRSSGEKLNGTATDSRNAKWESSNNLVLGGDSHHGCVMVTDKGPLISRLKIPEGYKTIRIEAEVRPVVADDTREGFITIGLGKPPAFNISWLSGVYLMLSPKGRAGIYIHPDVNSEDPNKDATVGIQGLSVKSFKPGEMNKMVLEYDVAGNTVSAWVNDEVVAEHVPLETKAFTPVLETMGFTGWWMKSNEPLVTNFTVTLN